MLNGNPILGALFGARRDEVELKRATRCSERGHFCWVEPSPILRHVISVKPKKR